MIGLGIDAGGSSIRWLLQEGTTVLGRGRHPSPAGPLYTDEARSETYSLFRTMAAEAAAAGRPSAAVAGVAGLDEGETEAERLSAVLAQALGLPQARVRVVNDMQIAFRSAFAPQQGVLVYGGTGSIACCELADGSLLRVGGHGYLIDDAGGGFWIGRRALRQVLRAADETGRLDGPLAEALCAALDAHDWPGIRAAIYGGGRSRIASLAPAVAAAAAAGDEGAQAIVLAAGRELGRLAVVLSARIGQELPVALAGGITRLGEPLLTGMRTVLGGGRELRAVDVEPVEAAARMALELAGSD